jgi:energy-coupling factor transporter ATP-binding protein EcfA2
MKFTEFKIKNFKGIEDVIVNLDKSPDANIYTLVGLNESGKTTILEAINFFNTDDKEGLSELGVHISKINDFNVLIPISKRDNFNDTILLEVTLKLDQDDIKRINEFALENTSFRKIKNVDNVKYFRRYIFKDSRFVEFDNKWTGFDGCLKTEQLEKYISIRDKLYNDDNLKLSSFCKTLIPSILYFPNFLFDFPSRVYIEFKDKPKGKEEFYVSLIQDILNSLENDSNIETHLVNRKKNGDSNDLRNLDSLLKKMGKKVTDIVFEAWNRIFKREIKETRIVINCNLDSNGFTYLDLEIEAQDGIYQINERSLGFRWFFIFLLFTQFRPFRKDAPLNVIYLFDEPASNLHSTAQKQLLSFENLTKNSKIIYTTHSHNMINPNWLESTYVVKNEGLKLEDPETYNIKKTNITIEPYREFVIRHPHNTAYFQPILDVLDYSPSDLELLPNCVFMEGKNDYYTLAYFQNIILSKSIKLNMAPSTGSGNLETLISLYIGWGREFIILLDSDKEGNKQKRRYIEQYGIILETRCFTLNDIDPTWNNNFQMEKLFDPAEALQFQKSIYTSSTDFNKIHFNRTIQECLINKITYNFSEQTKINFDKILNFLSDKLSC